MAAITAMFVLARRWRHDSAWITHSRFTNRVAFVATAGLGAFIVTQAAQLESIDGLAQRLFVAPLLVWIAVTALRLRRIGTSR